LTRGDKQSTHDCRQERRVLGVAVGVKQLHFWDGTLIVHSVCNNVIDIRVSLPSNERANVSERWTMFPSQPSLDPFFFGAVDANELPLIGNSNQAGCRQPATQTWTHRRTRLHCRGRAKTGTGADRHRQPETTWSRLIKSHSECLALSRWANIDAIMPSLISYYTAISAYRRKSDACCTILRKTHNFRRESTGRPNLENLSPGLSRMSPK
ncbi:hypothetical protein C8F04DRAFT_1091063, partial [Mycena alexandri]